MPQSTLPQYWQTLLQPIIDALGNPAARPSVTSLFGSAHGFLLTLITRRLRSTKFAPPFLVVTGSDDAAERLYNDLRFFHTLLGLPADQLALFPTWGLVPYETSTPPSDLVAQRMHALLRLAEGLPTIVIAPVQALLQKVVPRTVFRETCFQLRLQRDIDREELLAKLLRLGYRQASVVEIPGEFSVRGGIVDIFSTAYDAPLRIEFLGDTVDAIRMFDPSTQTSSEKRREAWVLPAREAIRPAAAPDALLPLTAEAEWRAPAWYPAMDTVLDYFSTPPCLALDQPAFLASEATAYWGKVEDEYLRHSEQVGGNTFPTPNHHFTLWESLLAQAHNSPWLAMESVVSSDAAWSPTLEFPAQPPAACGLNLRGTPFTDTLMTLDRLRQAGPVVISARAQAQVGRLLALFSEHDLPATPWTTQAWAQDSATRAPFYLVHGDVSSGFVCRDIGFTIVTEEEVFAKGTRQKQAAKSKTAAFLASLDELSVGDCVVHVQYGIGRYRGLKRLSIQGHESDYLILEYARADTLYVPLDRLNQVQRYIGAEGSIPRLDKLGGNTWEKTKARAKKDIEEMAHELVALYASREVVQRGAYHGDRTMLHDFEAAFDYDETPDQLRAVEDIKRDLSSTKPMDRLVCGDVGYGKTEVAMRAAFLAVEHNRQVAVLVPTTLLAHQHYDNFAQRFAPFPARVALLSRFQNPKETKQVLKDLAAGTIDVIIGTHRLLQKDVTVPNLGLVIIDEEQWFGVRHKERLKQLRTHVDVLTLTATPIPRTLQMAMAGVRDLSVIETPPPGRLAIRTQVARVNDMVVRDAIIRELARGGQVYFVHNRIETLQRMGTWLQQLVPHARIVMAHGQMDGRALEGVMMKFFQREADILVATAIIQSGLDIPNANTIIVNRADMFGLSQLYQLRGRVGRSGQQAHAYFLVPDEGALTSDAQKRLIAIQQFTELGAGFRIAAADLEIRGAGNLLGRQQSGHIAAIGMDLYLRMVEEAVSKIKGQPIQEDIDPTLHLAVSAYIPEDYVPDAHQRLALYKRLAGCTQLGELALIHSEAQDRYGPTPEPLDRLLEVMQIRVYAKALRLLTVEVKTEAILLTLPTSGGPSPERVQALMDRYPRRLKFPSPTSIEVQMPTANWPTLFHELSVALQTLQLCGTTERTPHE